VEDIEWFLSGEEGVPYEEFKERLDTIDYYKEAEYEEQMNRLEDMLLGGDVD